MSGKPGQNRSDSPELDTPNETAGLPQEPSSSDGNNSSQPVSRETSDVSDAQAMLNEILERTMPDPKAAPPEEAQEEKPSSSEEGPVPPPPGKNRRSSFYVYLAILFGAAFLMLLLAYFVQQRNNDDALNNLRSINTASRQELLEEIERLEQENEQLQKDVTYQKERVTQKGEEASRLQENLEYANRVLSDRSIQRVSLEYFWYLDRFMENRDYSMAAAAIVFSAEYLRSTWNDQVQINPVQVERYEAHRQELIDKGYLQQLDQPRDGGTDIWFTERWDPSKNEDTAALSILWLALEHHFINRDDHAASQYLFYYPLGNPHSGYQDRVERLASDFTLKQFQVMKDELVESKWLVIAEDGTMSEGFGPDDGKVDILYSLPFDLPEGALAYVYVYGD